MLDFPELLTRAIHDSAMTLQELSDELGRRGTPLSKATLSYWCKGRSVPSRPGSRTAVTHLEELLGLAPGLLVSALAGPAEATWYPTVALDYSPAFRAALNRMGMTLDPQLTALMIHDRITVGAAGSALEHEESFLVRAIRPAVRVFPMLVLAPAPGARVISVSGSHGCRSIAWELVDDDVLLVKLGLEREMRAGDLLQPRLTVRWGSGDRPLTRFRRPMPAPVEQRALTIDFTDEAPERVTLELTNMSGESKTSELAPARQVGHAMLATPSGHLGVSWSP
ncbi:hypothetical protein [Luteococcus sp. OSA5]|uniref:hypothetical protein n=1 Tax=Luteococcus sp. OSA5 TaxID=3401630 RepID=UPI003B42855B